jgi:hypothetical protein
VHDAFELGPLAAQRLCAFGRVPDVRRGELAFDLGQAVGLLGVVKDTS